MSRRLVQFIGDPEKYPRHKVKDKERRADGRYYDKTKHLEATRKHRDYKRGLLGRGLLSPTGIVLWVEN